MFSSCCRERSSQARARPGRISSSRRLLPALFWAGLVLVPTYAAIDVARFPAPTDFRCLYTAARMVARAEDPYDRAAWTRAVGGPAPDGAGIVRPSPCRGFDRAGAPLDRF